jgi:hypothetical protein
MFYRLQEIPINTELCQYAALFTVRSYEIYCQLLNLLVVKKLSSVSFLDRLAALNTNRNLSFGGLECFGHYLAYVGLLCFEACLDLKT